MCRIRGKINAFSYERDPCLHLPPLHKLLSSCLPLIQPSSLHSHLALLAVVVAVVAGGGHIGGVDSFTVSFSQNNAASCIISHNYMHLAAVERVGKRERQRE